MSTSIEISKTFVPAEIIEYAASSVVSKTILKKPTGNITPQMAQALAKRCL